MAKEHPLSDHAGPGLGCLEALGSPATVTAPTTTGIDDACAWLASVSGGIRAELDAHGALYLRGLPISSAEDFAAVRDVLVHRRAEYREKATPRSTFGNDVFSSTDLPPSQPIRLHNENSYTLSFPGILLFCCLTAPEEGGATPVADCRQVLANLPPDLAERFRERGWALTRNYAEHISLDWRTAFAAAEPGDVERYCDENLIAYAWGPGDHLRTTQLRPATIHHPSTGEEVWFNHAAFWSEWALEPEIREVLIDEFGRDGLPFNTSFGDGTPLEPGDVAALDDAYERATLRRSWEVGDLLVVDNVLAAHGREPFRGDRKIAVAMGDPVALADCAPTVEPCAGLRPVAAVSG